MSQRELFLKVSLLHAILLSGCVTTREMTVDYPIPPATIKAINQAGGRADIVLSDSETAAGERLTVDSVTARWLEGEWRAAPLAGVRSLTVRDPVDSGKRLLTGTLYGAAGFAAIGLLEGLTRNRPGVVGEALLLGAAGGLATAIAYDTWGPLTGPRVRFTIRPPRSAEESARRDADRIRIEDETRISIPELNIRSRNLRVEPTILFGRGNSVDPESDPSSPLLIGGGLSFGIRFWERLEMGLGFSVASHSFHRSNPDESVTRLSLMLTGTVFPLEKSGLFVRGGIGYGSYSASATYTGSIRTSPPVTPSTVTADGLALSIGGGYDIRLADAWSLRPAVQYSITPLSGMKLNDQSVIAAGKTSRLVLGSLSIVYKGVM